MKNILKNNNRKENKMKMLTPEFIAAAIAYFCTNMYINDSSRGWEGVIAAGVVGGLVGVLNVQWRKE